MDLRAKPLMCRTAMFAALLMLTTGSAMAQTLETLSVTRDASDELSALDSTTTVVDTTGMTATSPPGIAPRDGDLANESLARSAQTLATWSTLGLTVGGLTLMSAGSRGGMNDAQRDLGGMMFTTGLLFGPSLGWASAGYWDRAGLGALTRAGLVGAGFVVGLGVISGNGSSGWEELGFVVLGVLVGVGAAGVEGIVECSRMGPYIRKHGRAYSQHHVSLLTPHGPGLAVTLALP